MSRQAADEAFRFRQGLSVPPQKNLFCCYCFQYNLNMLFAGGANPRSKGTRQGQRILSPWKITSRIFNGNFWELCIPPGLCRGEFFLSHHRRWAKAGTAWRRIWKPLGAVLERKSRDSPFILSPNNNNTVAPEACEFSLLFQIVARSLARS